MAADPFEIIVNPFEVYVAPTGEAFPVIDATPAGNWVKIGKSGSKSMDEAGVTITHTQAIDQIRTYGATGPVKAIRTSEDLMVAFTLFDLLLAEYARTLNNSTVGTTAAASGVAGFKEVDLISGFDVNLVALLIRGPSPEGVGASSGWNMQYEVPKAYHNGSPAPVFVKNAAAGLAFEYMAVEDLAAAAGKEFGRLVVQDADAL